MKLVVLRERNPHETRVALVPNHVKRYIELGFSVHVEEGLGKRSFFEDKEYEKQGAKVEKDIKKLLKDADLLLKVQGPYGVEENEKTKEFSNFSKKCHLVGLLNPHEKQNTKEKFSFYERNKITSFSMELLPRITRAQSMDVLSSQANLAGYKAVLDAAHEYKRAFPMMMTAAGTIPPAKVLVLGAGVAGLQAIATAKRLGAVVHAFDVRAAVKEQVESLGASFVEVEASTAAETDKGYAKETSKDYQKKQAKAILESLKKSDIAICTAQIPGKKAPLLITKEMVREMKPGSVIVDLAVEQGGNCELSTAGAVLNKHNVAIVGHLNVPGRLSEEASVLYSKNLFNFVDNLYNQEKKQFIIDEEDEIIKATLLTKAGLVVHSDFIEKKSTSKSKAITPKNEKTVVKKTVKSTTSSKSKAVKKANGQSLNGKADFDQKDQTKH